MDTVLSRLKHASEELDQDRRLATLYRVGQALLVLLFILSGTVLIGFEALPTGGQTLRLAVGQVAPEDIRAPFGITYESVVLTEQARQAARERVPDIYDPPNPGIARQQIEQARQILDYIANVRADEFALPEELRADIQAINALSLDEDVIEAILNAPDERWGEIEEQIISVLERVMRDEIRDDTLRVVRQNLPNMVSVQFRVDEADLITAIVDDLIRINTFFNEELTRQARETAAEAVEPIKVEIRQGERLVGGGDIVTAADMEALTQLGLLQPSDRRLQQLLSAFLAMLLATAIFALFLNRFHRGISQDTPLMILLGGAFLVMLAGARVMGPQRVVQPYVFPSAALGLLMASLVGPPIAIVGMTILAVLLGIMAGGTLPLAVMSAMGGMVGILTLRHTERVNSYFVSGMIISLMNVGVVLVFYLAGSPADPLGALTLIGAGLLNGILAAAVALIALYLIGSVFNVPTNLKLIELTQSSQPLLRQLLREAPGTYQHSLQVANLAELAAERIGANATLTRAGALYHDVGKMTAPHFFVENQADGVNPHDALNDPYKSARIIIDHVVEGERLVRQYRLPPRIRDFVLEHHGTTRPLYFYRQAVEQAGGDESAVDVTLFTYPGPVPRSRETSVLMLADSCESTVRARRPQNKQEIADVVKQVFETRMNEGQLDNSGLTLHDLSVMQRVFVETLQGVFHPRIAYPKEAVAAPNAAQAPAPPASKPTPPAKAVAPSNDRKAASVAPTSPGEEAIPIMENRKAGSGESPTGRPTATEDGGAGTGTSTR